MRGSAVRVASSALLAIAGVVIGVGLTTSSVGALTTSGGTTIDAIVCQASSSASIVSPVSDSIVTQPTVPLTGSVSQANQIEVYIDTVLDHIIPLTPSQTSFSGSVQLVEGTHTIRVVAINACSGTNGSDTAVVTYQPQTGGGDDEPNAEVPVETEEGGVQVGGDPLPEEQATATGDDSTGEIGLSPIAVIDPLLEWLNIKTADSGDTEGLSVWRAIAIGAGLYLATVGMTVVVVQMVAGFPMLQGLLPAASPSLRKSWVSWGFRVVGLILIGLALLL